MHPREKEKMLQKLSLLSLVCLRTEVAIYLFFNN